MIIITYEDIVKWWQSQNISTVEDFESTLYNFQIIFTCNSNNIEGENISYHTTREIFEGQPITSSGVLPRQVFEVQNQKYAFKAILKLLEKKVPLSIPVIKRIHKRMMYGTYDDTRWIKGERPGSFKVGDYCVGLTDEGTSPEFVEEDLTDLLNEIYESNGDPLITATYFHVMFESIHPFADGNGRVGRALLNYYLMSRNYPPMIIYNEDKNTYYLGLEVYDRTGEIKGLVQFFKEQTIKTWKSRVLPKRYTTDQMKLARELAPIAYRDLPDDELWDLVGNYVVKIE